MCAACYDPATQTFSRSTRESMRADNLSAMGTVDFLALLLASWFVALAISNELRDILLCRTLRRAAALRDSAPGQGWQNALWLLDTLRRFTMIPTLGITILWLVMIRGADALTICFK